ncbi:MAG TPA: choice-of-anchor V domain-containing protein [Gemmatimonadales bacterium]|nr:choice-of-anchor V domain-containing protein [Gemmatimonadales bacterium]
MRRAGLAALLALGGAFAVAGAPLRTHPDGPPLRHTGGFGEPTCEVCHMGDAPNDPAGSLRLEGVPARWDPGGSYELVVVLDHPELQRAGFELAVRFAEGGEAGRQAGVLEPAGPRARVSLDSASGVWYAHHTLLGTEVVGHSTRWQIRWTAPSAAAGPVVIHVAANAANDDASPLGDRIYTGAWFARR